MFLALTRRNSWATSLETKTVISVSTKDTVFSKFELGQIGVLDRENSFFTQFQNLRRFIQFIVI